MKKILINLIELGKELKTKKHNLKKCIEIPKVFQLPLLAIFPIFLLFLGFAWFVSDPIRAAKIDRFILYSTDDEIRWYFVKNSFQNPSIFIYPYTKPVYTIIAALFSRLIPLGEVSLRIMNSYFSAAILWILYKLVKKLEFENSCSVLAILITASVPLYFLASISELSEIIFGFFLILSIYMFYSERHLLAIILISFLPLARQEGLIFLGFWSFFLLGKRKFKYIPILFIPSFVWILLNYLILKQPISYTFFYANKIPDMPLPTHSLMPPPVSFLLTLGYPTLSLFLIGLAMKLFDKKYLLILISLCPYLIILTLVHLALVLFFDTRYPGFELRYMVSIVPLLVIYAVVPINALVKKFVKQKGLVKYSLIFVAVLLLLSHIHQLKILQGQPGAKAALLEQREILKEASGWISDYIKKEKVKTVYIPGPELTARRKLWANLSCDVKYFTLDKDKFLVYDIITFKPDPNHKMKGIGITIDKENFSGISGYKLIKEFPSIPLYFYLLKEVK